jgi:hypothetical protein
MSKYSPAPYVIATDLGNELVLLDPRNGEMFGLNACGRRVWLALSDASAEQLVERLCTEFDVGRERAAADVRSLLQALEQHGLVVCEAAVV